MEQPLSECDSMFQRILGSQLKRRCLYLGYELRLVCYDVISAPSATVHHFSSAIRRTRCVLEQFKASSGKFRVPGGKIVPQKSPGKKTLYASKRRKVFSQVLMSIQIRISRLEIIERHNSRRSVSEARFWGNSSLGPKPSMEPFHLNRTAISMFSAILCGRCVLD